MWRISKNWRVTGTIISIAVLLLAPLDLSFQGVASLVQKRNIVDLLYRAKQNPNVVDNFGLGVRRAEAAADPDELEYMIDVGPINGVASANYVYASFFNPSGSGRAISVKRVAVRANAVAGANWVNLSVRRTTAASAGTQIAAADILHKNTSSSDPVMEVRHTNVTATFAGATQSRLIGQPMPGAAGAFYSSRDLSFSGDSETIVLQEGEGIALYQEAAGDTDQRIRMLVEWEELTSTPSAQNEYMIAIQRVENAAGVNYVYNSFLNPSGSGKTAIVKRLWYGSETCDTTAIYTNNLTVRRISAASGGTSISAANIPKKHTGSGNSAMEVRYTGVTVTQVGGADARLGNMTPCGVASQPTGWQQIDFDENNERLILQAGEGVALIADTAGDADQLVRMFVEWEEVDTGDTPTAGEEYLWGSSRVEVAAALGTTFYTAFNPSGSGKVMEVKRIALLINADGTAAYSALNVQRISAASGGALIGATDLPKKHTGSANSAMEVRWCGATCGSAITTTYVGARSTAASGLSDSGLFKVNMPGTVGQLIGMREIVFGDEEPIILQEGEGLGVYLNYLAGNANHYVKIQIEWGEVSSAPSARNQYLIDIGTMPGNTGTSYNYASFFNPSGSGKAAIIKRISLRMDVISTAVYVPMRIRRTTAASGGTSISAANIPKKHTGSGNSAMEIRRTGVTVTYAQSADAQLISVITPGTVAAATAPSLNGYKELNFVNDEEVVLQPGEGIALHHDTSAGDADFRSKLLIEWEEVDTASTPTAEEEHIIGIGPVNASLTQDYVYATFFNPADSEKNYLIKRIGVRADRTGTLVAPGYIPISARRITAASGGTQITTANIPKKHTSSVTTGAEVRYGGVTASFDQATSSRIVGVTAPGVVRQGSGDIESLIYTGDELVLGPGEGIALYQEAAAGDTLLKYQMSFAWQEADVPFVPSLTFSISDNTVGFGSLNANSARYATGDGAGTAASTTVAHTISIATNAPGGYALSVSGNTLRCASCDDTDIDPAGSSAVASIPGTEQFGMRISTSSGTGVTVSPYSTSDFAFDTGAFPDTVATGSGDEVTTVFDLRYLANIATLTDPGSYGAVVSYTVTGTF